MISANFIVCMYISFGFLLDILFIYISHVIPFPKFPFANLISPPPYPDSMRFLPLHLPTPTSLHWGFKPSQDQGPPLPLMPEKAPSAPWVLPLTPPLGSLLSVRWLALSIHLCICHVLAEPLRRQLYQVPVSMYFLASAILSGFGGCIWAGYSDGQSLDGLCFSPCSTLCLRISSCEYFCSAF